MDNGGVEADRGERVWGGDWRTRLIHAVKTLGYESVSAFLSAHPCTPYLVLADMLGDHIAALQIVWSQFREAVDSGKLRDAAIDCLVRELHRHLKRGWGKGMRADFHTAGVYAVWVGEVTRFTPSVRPQADAVWQALAASRPPQGWLPSSSADLLVLNAFSIGWPN